MTASQTCLGFANYFLRGADHELPAAGRSVCDRLRGDGRALKAFRVGKSSRLSWMDFPGIPAPSGLARMLNHFWTIEFLYTYGTPARESLTNSFIAYAVDSSAAQNALRRYGYTPCGGSPRSITATLCGSSGNG